MNPFIYEMIINGVDEDDIDMIMQKLGDKVSEQKLDRELALLGYEKIFATDENSNEYENFECIKKKREIDGD